MTTSKRILAPIWVAILALGGFAGWILWNLSASVTPSTTILLAVVVALSVVILGAGVATMRSISRPLRMIALGIDRLAKGDGAFEVPALGRKDDVGRIADALVALRTAAIDNQQLQAEAEKARHCAEAERRRHDEEGAGYVKAHEFFMKTFAAALKRLSDGDVDFRLTQPYSKDYENIRADFNASVEKLQQTMQAVGSNTLLICGGAREISASADDLSQRTEQQSASLEQTAASLDEITATVKKAAEGAHHAHEVVAISKSDAEKGGDIVRKAIAAMAGIEKSSQQIGQIIGVIDEIAFQTNLLALNAGVEAARAGDAGRGFAVVASEVRALAQRSAEAAKEIKSLVSTSTAQVSDGVKLVGETGKALERIVAQVADINDAVSAIARSANEQATGLQQVNAAVNQMDQMTQQNASMAEETTTAAHALARETEELTRLIGRFRVGEIARAEPTRRATTNAPPARRQALRVVASGGAAAQQ